MKVYQNINQSLTWVYPATVYSRHIPTRSETCALIKGVNQSKLVAIFLSNLE